MLLQDDRGLFANMLSRSTYTCVHLLLQWHWKSEYPFREIMFKWIQIKHEILRFLTADHQYDASDSNTIVSVNISKISNRFLHVLDLSIRKNVIRIMTSSAYV